LTTQTRLYYIDSAKHLITGTLLICLL